VLQTAGSPNLDEDFDIHNHNITFIDDGKTTVEIFRENRRVPEYRRVQENRQVPENRRTVYQPVNIEAQPSFNVESSSSDIYRPEQDEYPTMNFDEASGFTSDGRDVEAKPTRLYPQQNSFVSF